MDVSFYLSGLLGDCPPLAGVQGVENWKPTKQTITPTTKNYSHLQTSCVRKWRNRGKR